MGLFDKLLDKGSGTQKKNNTPDFPLSSDQDQPDPALETAEELQVAEEERVGDQETPADMDGIDILDSYLEPEEEAPQGPADPAKGNEQPPENGEHEQSDDPLQGLGPVEVAEDSEPASEEEVDEDLMDIFTSEEEEDVDLSALTGSLEEIDPESILQEARDVAGRLREFLGDN